MRNLNRELTQALGLVRGVSHAEFIRARGDGNFYFLECAARVGGAYISEMVEIATGINLWREWARIEIAGGKEPYQLPAVRIDYAGLILSLARQEIPTPRPTTIPKLPYASNDVIMPAWFSARQILRGFRPCWRITAGVSPKNSWPSNRPAPSLLRERVEKSGFLFWDFRATNLSTLK